MADRKAKRDENDTLDGTIERIVFSSEDERFAVVVVQLDGGETIRAAGQMSGVSSGERMRLIGSYRDDERFGRQFKVVAAYPILPHSEEGLRGYLGGGRIPSIGPKLADRLVDYFKTETLDIIINHPERLVEVSGIGPNRSRDIAEQVRDRVHYRDALIFLRGQSISSSVAERIWRRYGETTIPVVRENPYVLAVEVRGIGFKTSDQIAQAMGFETDSPARIAAGLVHVLGSAADDGHVHVPRENLIEQTTRLLGEGIDVEAQIDALLADGRLIDDNGIYLTAMYASECELAEQVLRVGDGEVQDLTEYEAISVAAEGLELAPAQRNAIALAARASLMILTGGPGTGKTTTVKAIMRLLGSTGERILLAAPTGRAAKRLSETTGQPASTLHRLLGYNPMDGFRHNEDEPLEAGAVIVDEASMLDQSLALAFLRAVSSGTRVILVGDADQLPSVGAGNVLADLLASGSVPAVRLHEIFRQSRESEIVVNAHRILEGEIPISATGHEMSDFYVIEVDTPARAAELIGTMVADRIPRRFQLDPLRDIQVLAPMHRGVCGAQQLNVMLQERLNPNGADTAVGGRGFRVGDKVMQVRNDYQKDVFNGDIGRVIARAAKGLIIRFDRRQIEYDREALDNVVLAYACSVHKSQGSEYPAVILPLLTEHWVMLQRNLLYTALTRGRRLVILVGQKRAIARAVKNTDGVVRNTGLTRRLEAHT